MALREDIRKIISDYKEHDITEVFIELGFNHEVRNHKRPIDSIRSCFARMVRAGEATRIMDKTPMTIRRV